MGVLRWFRAVAFGGLLAGSLALAQEPGGYKSPYRLAFKVPEKELIGDLAGSERGDPRMESEEPHNEWYSPKTRKHYGSWGPPHRRYPAHEGWSRWSAEFKRERVIATASRFIGYGYQHHHVPDWSPPAGWPWEKTAVGHNGKGVDCSNLTSFVYDQAFGIHLNGDVHKQAEEVSAQHGNRPIRGKRITLPQTVEERAKVLKTGDLLYIKSKEGRVSHVVLWVGEIGKDESGNSVHLVLDSHGDGVTDSRGVHIPVGIHLRPYQESSWYHHSASHAIRWIE
jgi:cell wall-associated NlpC family hydrolase